MVKLLKSAQKNRSKQQNQNWPATSWMNKFVLLWKCIIFCDNVDKVFLVKQQTNLVKPAKRGKEWEGDNCIVSIPPFCLGGAGGLNLLINF